MSSKRFLIILAAVIAILAIPLIAMQFTTEVDWNLTDFLVAGGMLLIAGLLFNLVLTQLTNRTHRLLASIGLGLVFVLVWMELAVGIFN